MNRPVNIGLSPNLEADDVSLAVKVLLTGGEKDAKAKLVKWFENYFPGFTAIPFNSGRSAEWAIIKALGLKSDDEVLYQDFTCVAVPNSVEWVGAKAVGVVTDPETLDINLIDLEKKIGPKTQAVIVQHTFGQAADLKKIKQICDKNKLILIEDCAHALGATYQDKKLGTFGKVAFFSLGRDKVVSSVFGGMTITKDPKLARKLIEIEADLSENSWSWVTQQLLHPILTWLLLPLSPFDLGKAMWLIAQKLQLLSMAVYETERQGGQPSCFPAKYSPKLATLGLHQLHKLARFNQHRRDIAAIYFKQLTETGLGLPSKQDGGIYLRFTVTHPKARELYLRAKVEKKWILGDWYKSALPVLNLPTYPNFTEVQAKQLCDQIKIWLKLTK